MVAKKKTSKEKKYLNPDMNNNFARSNVLIESKIRTTLLENKIIALAMANAEIDRETNQPTAVLPISLIRKQLKMKGTNIYTQLKEFADRTISHKIIVEENLPNGDMGFKIYYLVNKVEYPPGEGYLKLYFDPEIAPHLRELKSNYTIVNIDTLMSFKSNHTYRIFELLSTKQYLLNQMDEVTVHYNLADLKMKMGLVDTDNDKVEKLMRNKKKLSTAEEIMKIKEIEESSQYSTWYDFKRGVLEVAKKELNSSQLSPIIFDYDMEKLGKGARVVGVIFKIRKNPLFWNIADQIDNQNNEESDLDEIAENVVVSKKKQRVVDTELLQEVLNMFDEPITIEQAATLLDEANNNICKIKYAYELAMKQESIYNLIGWMRKAIREDWTDDTIPKMKGKSYKETQEFNDLYQEYLEGSTIREDNYEIGLESDTDGQMVIDFNSREDDQKNEKSILEQLLKKEGLSEKDRETLEAAMAILYQR